jgi:hypothetical protein
MKYINEKSIRGLTNFLADYIVCHINKKGDFDSVIELTNVGKFIIINGLTTCNELIDLPKIQDELKEDYKDYLSNFPDLHLNFIDAITYEVSIHEPQELWFKFHNLTKRPVFSSFVEEMLSENNNIISINDKVVEIDFNDYIDYDGEIVYPPLNINSEFPYGYSLKMGRSQFYYSEYIVYNIFNTINATSLDLKFSTKTNDNDDFNISVISNSIYNEKHVKSLILDCFDFDINSFNETLNSYNILDDILKPFEVKPWLIKDVQPILI